MNKKGDAPHPTPPFAINKPLLRFALPTPVLVFGKAQLLVSHLGKVVDFALVEKNHIALLARRKLG